MSDIPRLQPETVRERQQRDSDTLLVCAYDDDAKCRSKHIDSAIPLSELEQRGPAKDQHLVFYCA